MVKHRQSRGQEWVQNYFSRSVKLHKITTILYEQKDATVTRILMDQGLFILGLLNTGASPHLVLLLDEMYIDTFVLNVP